MKMLSMLFSCYKGFWRAVLASAVVFSGCASMDRQWDAPPESNPDLEAHSSEFRREVIEVTELWILILGEKSRPGFVIPQLQSSGISR